MASIIEGQQYALNSQFSNNRGQSMVFVKLTDSALKAIEDYAAAVSKVCLHFRFLHDAFQHIVRFRHQHKSRHFLSRQSSQSLVIFIIREPGIAFGDVALIFRYLHGKLSQASFLPSVCVWCVWHTLCAGQPSLKGQLQFSV